MAKVKAVKKKWVPVFASKEFNNIEIGEIPCEEPSKLIGKVIRVNLYNLTNDSRRQNSEIAFKIIKADEKKADTEAVDFKILSAHLKRTIKKEKEKIDDSFECETKDKIKMRVKPLMITRNRTNNSNLTNLRMNTRKKISEYAKGIEYEKFLKEVAQNNIQRGMKNELKKVYPLNIFEIREVVKVNNKK
jgi:ribosomal protein S3AE